MQLHQFVHTLNYGDAISGEALTIKRLLEAKGIVSNIYTVNTHERLTSYARNYKDLAEDLRQAAKAGEHVAIVLHYSIASPLNDLFVELEGVAKVFLYHNITPPEWFANYNKRVVADLIKGRAEMPRVLAAADIILADSSFNAEELNEQGFNDVRTLPLALDTEKWNIAANPGIAGILKHNSRKNVLHVGRIAPNKCIQDIIKAFYFYHHKIEQNSHLWLVGIDNDTEIYSFELKRMISEFRLKDAVTFARGVSDGELKSFYENSDVYLCMSEHEGFCLPLIEAMSFGIPVIAFESGAVPETVGNAAILVKEKVPHLLAELIDSLVTDVELRQNLIKSGHANVSRFRPENFEKSINDVLLEPLSNIRGLGSQAVTSETRRLVSN